MWTGSWQATPPWSTMSLVRPWEREGADRPPPSGSTQDRDRTDRAGGATPAFLGSGRRSLATDQDPSTLCGVPGAEHRTDVANAASCHDSPLQPHENDLLVQYPRRTILGIMRLWF